MPASASSPLPMPTAGTVTVRFAGALYVLIIACGLTAELALRGPLFAGPESGHAAALAAGLRALRASLALDLVMLVADIALALTFFELLRHVSEPLARAAMAFRLMQAALIGVSLVLLAGAPAMLDADLPDLAVRMVALHALGYDVGLVLFGVNAALMAWLLGRSGAVPRLVVAGLGGSALVYVAGGAARLVAPDLVPLIQPAYLLPVTAETALALWLLVVGRV